MTREEAIAILGEEAEYLYQDDEPYNREAFRMAIKALSQEPCEDAISRKDVINAIDKWISEYKPQHYLMQSIRELPSVTQKSGKWLYIREDKYTCSKCGTITRVDEGGIDEKPMYKFCPYCSAKMVEPQESEG